MALPDPEVAPKQPMDEIVNIPEQPKGTVRYIGQANRRSISPAEWDMAGVPDHKESSWDQGNEWTLPMSDFNKSSLEYFPKDNGFRVVEK